MNQYNAFLHTYCTISMRRLGLIVAIYLMTQTSAAFAQWKEVLSLSDVNLQACQHRLKVVSPQTASATSWKVTYFSPSKSNLTIYQDRVTSQIQTSASFTATISLDDVAQILVPTGAVPEQTLKDLVANHKGVSTAYPILAIKLGVGIGERIGSKGASITQESFDSAHGWVAPGAYGANASNIFVEQLCR